jgi:hypothetical protein
MNASGESASFWTAGGRLSFNHNLRSFEHEPSDQEIHRRDGGNRACEPCRRRGGTNTGHLGAGHSLYEHIGQRRNEQQQHGEYPYVTKYTIDPQHRRSWQLHREFGLFVDSGRYHPRQREYRQREHVGSCRSQFAALS